MNGFKQRAPRYRDENYEAVTARWPLISMRLKSPRYNKATMTDVSGGKFISQQVKAFLVAGRKRVSLGITPFRCRSDAEVPRLDGPFDSMHQFPAGFHFFFSTRFYFIIDVADDPSLSPTPKSATIARKIMRPDSFALFLVAANSVNCEKFLAKSALA